MVVITISNGEDADNDSECGDDRGVITNSNGDDADTNSECGDDGGDHYHQWR